MCLTSCVVRLLERILADLLYHIDETSNMFSRFQAGFRKARSCEDQITRIVREIEDGFQQLPMKHSVLALLDFSKAYDTVSREKLLLHVLNTGIPSTFIHCIRSFLNTAVDVSNSSTSLIPVDVLLKVYLKVPFLPHYSFCFTLTIWPPRLKMMQLLPFLLMTSLSSLQLVKSKMLKLLPSQ